MAHPFEKIFDKALSKSDKFDNQVLDEAEKLVKLGYPGREVAQVLSKLQRSLIDKEEAEIVQLALDDFLTYLEDD